MAPQPTHLDRPLSLALGDESRSWTEKARSGVPTSAPPPRARRTGGLAVAGLRGGVAVLLRRLRHGLVVASGAPQLDPLAQLVGESGR
jgi:hypothetical protein